MSDLLIAVLIWLVSAIVLIVWLLPKLSRQQAELARVQAERDVATESLQRLEREVQAGREGLAQLEGARVQINGLGTQLSDAQREVAELRKDRDHLSQTVIQLQSSLAELDRKHQSERGVLLNLQKEFKDQFDALTKGLIDANSDKFLKQNQAALDPLLGPLKQKIEDFEKQVAATNKEETQQIAVLDSSIKRLEALNQSLGAEAKSLTSALLGQSKVQGDWGEVVLEQLLQSLGLVEGTHYEQQTSVTGDDGERLRPDFVLTFPDGRKIVLDAKVSLTAYYQWTTSVDEPSRRQALKQHLESVHSHIDELAARNYAAVEGLKGPKVVMFVAIEPAYIEAVRAEPSLYAEAFRKGVILATQSSLYTVLATLEYTWKQQSISRNAEEIAKQAGALYDKFADFAKDVERLGKQMRTTQITYDEAWTKLTGKGGLVSRTEKLRQLGIRNKKMVPTQALLDAELIDQEDEQLSLPDATDAES